MNKKVLKMPKFKNEGEEADWWASPLGRAYVKQKSAETRSKGTPVRGSSMVGKLNRQSSVQIALPLPAPELEHAREFAARKGMEHHAALKMLVRAGRAGKTRRR